MRKRGPIVALICLVFVAAVCVLMLHPVKVMSQTEVKYKLRITGIKYTLDTVSDSGGGYRVYLDEDSYAWYSYPSIETGNTGLPMYIKYGFPWQKPYLNLGG